MNTDKAAKKVAVRKTLEEVFPNSVMALRFAQARADEIRAINAGALQRSNGRGGVIKGNPAGGGGKRTFQRLPRYLRRRAMSHNVHRIPAQYRNRAEKEMLKTYGPKAQDPAVRAEILRNKLKPEHKKIRRSRRYYRRPAHILRDTALRQRRFRWLPTHIWHAKRMFMGALWGLKIARRRTDRGLRASYRCGAFLCTAHDATYFACLQVDGPTQAAVLSAVCQVAHPLSGSPRYRTSTPGAAVHRTMGRAGVCVLHRRGEYPSGALCPAEFQWRPGCATLWLWVHPAAKADVLAELEAACNSTNEKESKNEKENTNEKESKNEIDNEKNEHSRVEVRERDDLLRFEVCGPRSSAVLHSVLRQGDVTAADAGTTALIGALPALQSPDGFPAGTALALTIKTPPAAPIGVALRPRRVVPLSTYTTGGGGTALARLFAQWEGPAATVATSPLWRGDAEELKRWAECTAVTGRETSPAVVATIPPTVPALLVQRPGSPSGPRHGLCAGWTVVAPARAAMRLWLSIVYAGAHAIGVEEREWCEFEGGAPSFPRDWPDTPPGHRDAAERAAAEAESYAKKPPAKRPNYAKLAVERPFAIEWRTLGVDPGRMFVLRSREDVAAALAAPEDPRWRDALVMGEVTFPAKGRPAPRAFLCVPEGGRRGGDLVRTVRTKKGKLRLGDLIEEEIDISDIGSNGNNNDDDDVNNVNEFSDEKGKNKNGNLKRRSGGRRKDVDIPLDRKVAGFVSMGSFSYAARAGRACGFCALRLLAPLIKNGCATLLLRNITSKHYFEVKFVPIP